MKKVSSENELPQEGTSRDADGESLHASACSPTYSGEGTNCQEDTGGGSASREVTEAPLQEPSGANSQKNCGHSTSSRKIVTAKNKKTFDKELFCWCTKIKNRNLIERMTAAAHLADLMRDSPNIDDEGAEALGESATSLRKWVSAKEEYLSLQAKIEQLLLDISDHHNTEARFVSLVAALEKSLDEIETKMIDANGVFGGNHASTSATVVPGPSDSALNDLPDKETEIAVASTSGRVICIEESTTDKENTTTPISETQSRLQSPESTTPRPVISPVQEEAKSPCKSSCPIWLNEDMINDGRLFAKWIYPQPVTVYLSQEVKPNWWSSELADLRTDCVRARRKHQRHRRRKTRDETYEEVEAQLHDDFRAKRRILQQAIKKAKAEHTEEEPELPSNLKIVAPVKKNRARTQEA